MTILAVLFLTRRPPVRMGAPWETLLALAGTFVPALIVREAPGGARLAGELVEAVSLMIVTAAAVSLGRSFGLAPADRGLRTGGPYRWVRHPLYAGEILFFAGYLLANPSTRNVLALVLMAAIQVARIAREERLLDRYAQYAARVRWRLVPGIWMLALVAGLPLATGCSAPSAAAPAAAPMVVGAAPRWQPGDRWVFDWTSGANSGTRIAEVVERRDVNGVEYYLVKSGEVSHYFTTSLHWAATARDGKIETRVIPPQPYFQWPLQAGQEWMHGGSWESAQGTSSVQARFVVAGRERVEVPAGHFETMRVTRDAGDRDGDQYWYAPDVRWYVKWEGRRGDTLFVERLREYRPAPRPSAETTPETTRP